MRVASREARREGRGEGGMADARGRSASRSHGVSVVEGRRRGGRRREAGEKRTAGLRALDPPPALGRSRALDPYPP